MWFPLSLQYEISWEEFFACIFIGTDVNKSDLRSEELNYALNKTQKNTEWS